MLHELLKNKEFISAVHDFYRKHTKEVLDIILFGSSVKGKQRPKDIDLLLLFRTREDLDVTYELRKKLKDFKIETQVISKTYFQLFDKNFRAREAFLGEGFSLIKRQFISEGLGYSNIALFKYELKGFPQSKRMRLQYAFYGRDKKSGIVKELKLIKFSNTIFLCPVVNTENLKEFFESWEIKFEEFPVLIPERILQ